MQQPVIFGTIKFLHDLLTAVWIGGLLVMTVVIMPSVRKTLHGKPEAKLLSDTIRSRLSILVYISMIGLVLTGVLMSNQASSFEGFFSISNQYSLLLTLKHIVIAVMVVISIVRSRILPRVLSTNPMKEQKLSAVMTVINMLLGVTVLFISGQIAGIEAFVT